MFNREEGLKNLEKLLKNEVEFVTPDMLLAIMTDKGFEMLKKGMEEFEDHRWIQVLKEMKSNVTKTLSKNNWITYEVNVDSDIKVLGHVNREAKRFVLAQGYKSVFDTLEDLAERISYRLQPGYLRSKTVQNISLEELEVLTTTQLKDEYEALKCECVLKFIHQYREQLIEQLDDSDKKHAEGDMLRKYTHNEVDFLSEETKEQEYLKAINFDNWSIQGILSLNEVFKSDLLFDLIDDKEGFKQVYMNELYQSAFGDEPKVSFYRLRELLYCEMVKDDLFQTYSEDYGLQLSREIRKAMKNGGKTIRVIDLDGKESKIENYVLNVTEIGRWHSEGIKNSDVQTILFGKKVLFDRNEFDEEYGHLKSVN